MFFALEFGKAFDCTSAIDVPTLNLAIDELLRKRRSADGKLCSRARELRDLFLFDSVLTAYSCLVFSTKINGFLFLLMNVFEGGHFFPVHLQNPYLYKN